MFPVQVYHRARTIGTASVWSAAALVRQGGHVLFSMISMLSKLMGTASGPNMAGMVDSGGMRTLGTESLVMVGGFGGFEHAGQRVRRIHGGYTAGVAGTVGLADGEHGQHGPWQTLGVQ